MFGSILFLLLFKEDLVVSFLDRLQLLERLSRGSDLLDLLQAELHRIEFLDMLQDRKCGDILKQARNRIAKIKKQLAFNGKIPAAVLSFDLKNNHGYRDKPAVDDLFAGFAFLCIVRKPMENREGASAGGVF